MNVFCCTLYLTVEFISGNEKYLDAKGKNISENGSRLCKKRQKKYTPKDMMLAIKEVMDKGKSISKVSKKYNIPYDLGM